MELFPRQSSQLAPGCAGRIQPHASPSAILSDELDAGLANTCHVGRYLLNFWSQNR